jgi:digeranylgeranylglycerophospholipid reductase
VSRRYDAVVAGAGPAGAATARDIAARGFRVLLLEEHRSIGEPNHCSGLVTPRTLQLAGTDDSIVLNRIRGAVIASASGRSVTLNAGATQALVIDRIAFDRQLARQAQCAGAELRTGTRLVDMERTYDGLSLGLEGAGRRERIETRLLIGADGVQSRVARWLGGEAGERAVGLGALIEMDVTRPEYVEVFAGPSVAPGFFAWLIPVGPQLARLGIATDGSETPVGCLTRLRCANPRFAGARVLSWSGGVIPLSLVEKPYADNVMLVGDAAGHVKPTSGGGIYAGLVGATHCAATAVQALSDGSLSGVALSSYHRNWLRELGAEFGRMQLLRRLFLSLSDGDIDRVLLLLRSPLLRRLVEKHGDIDFPSTLLSRLSGLRLDSALRPLAFPAVGEAFRPPGTRIEA